MQRDRDLFERHPNSQSFSDMTALEVVRRCEAIVKALAPYIPLEDVGEYGEGVVPLSACKALKTVVPIIENLDRHLPRILAWSVGYLPGEGWHRSTFFGCQSQAQAERLVDAINKVEGDDPRAKTWDAKLVPVSYNDMVKRNFTAEDAVVVIKGVR